jgi:Tfp pilus assembly protein PilN
LMAVSITQNALYQRENRALDNLKTQVGTYKEQEAIAFLLKSRMAGITQLTAKQYPQTAAFNLLTALTPDEVKIFAFKVDRTDKVNIQGETASTAALDTYFNNLVDPKATEGKIPKVTLSSLSKGNTGLLRFDLNVLTQGLGN